MSFQQQAPVSAFPFRALGSLLVSLAFGLTSPAATRIVMVTGGEVPGGDGRFKASGLHHGGLNDLGQVAFAAELSGTSEGFDNDTAVFVGDGTRLWMLAREGEAAPADGGTFVSFVTGGGLSLSNDGEVGFRARTRRDSQQSWGIYRGGTNGVLRRIAQTGEPLPGGDGIFGGNYGLPVLTPGGRLAFAASLDSLASGRNGLGIVVADPDPGVVRFLPFAQDVSSRFQATYQGLGPSLNSRGTVVFAGGVQRVTGGAAGLGVAIAADDGLRVTGYPGLATPDGLGNFLQTSPAPPVLNEAGQVAFAAEVEGLTGRHRALYVWRPEGMVEIASSSAQAPGPWRFGGFGAWDLNDAGRVAFLNTDRSGSGGLFVSDGPPATLERIVAEQQAAPDGNGTFSLVFRGSLPLVLNDAGQVAFGAELSGTSGGGDDSVGIFLHDTRWGLLQVARTGTPLLGSVLVGLGFRDAKAGTLGAVEAVGETFAELNDAGEVAYAFQLADGRTGIAIWSPADLANNRPPVSSGFSAVVGPGQQLTLTPADLLAVTSDPEGGPVALVSVDERTTQGVLFGAGFPAGNRTYRPPPGFVGVDEFTYVVRDELNFTTRVTGRLTVLAANNPPAAEPLIRYVRPGETATLSAAEILSAASDPDGDPLVLGSLPAVTQRGGAVAVDGDRIRVTPVLDRVSDQIGVEVSDGRGGTALVTVFFVEPNTLSLASRDAADLRFRLSALHGNWRIEQATALGGPWTSVATVEIRSGGRACARGTLCRDTVEFAVPESAAPATYYRAVQ